MRSSEAINLALRRGGASRSRLNGSVALGMNHFSPLFSSRLSQEDEADQARVKALPTVRMYHSSNPALYHTTLPTDRSFVALALGFGAVSAGAYAASSAVTAYNEWQASRPAMPPPEEESTEKAEEIKEEKKREEKKKEGTRENIFARWFEVGGKYYEGGFEDKMTRREAALVLGVRESSSVQRIKEAHRKLLVLNHPDTGGSTYMAGKINEAKELLLKGRSDK